MTRDDYLAPTVKCPACKGYGAALCRKCGGMGQYEHRPGALTTCPACAGVGRVECKRCDGYGEIAAEGAGDG